MLLIFLKNKYLDQKQIETINKGKLNNDDLTILGYFVLLIVVVFIFGKYCV